MDRYNPYKDLRLLFVASYFLIFTLSFSQSHNKFAIKFVETIDNVDAISNNSLLDRMSDLLFGDENINLVKPIYALASDSLHLWVVDQGVNGIIKIDKRDGDVSVINYDSKFHSFVSLCELPNNEILVTDSKKNEIYFYSGEKDQIRIFSNHPKLNRPTGITYNKKTLEIWCVQTGNHKIIVFDIYGNILREIGKRGRGKLEFNYPTYIWSDKIGNVYVVDAMNFRVQILSSIGDYISEFGEQGDATGFFARPKGIAVDSFGNIYLVDGLFHNVQIFDKNGNFLQYFGKQGTSDGEFWLPQGIFIDKKNKIYIADSYNSRIQIFQLEQK